MPSPAAQTVPNLIQGVSQQAAMQRRDSQCEAQFDCVNDIVNGCTARPGSDLLKFLSGADFTEAFFYEIPRSATERYLAVISRAAGVISVRIFNLASGVEAALTVLNSADDYLKTVPAGTSVKDAFRATTVEDFTFIANKTVTPSMDAGNTSPAAANEAIVHWRAGDYQVKYMLSIIYDDGAGDTNFLWTYRTPDNSTVANGERIKTGAIAATFYRAMTGTAAPVLGDSDAATGDAAFGVGAETTGDTSGFTGPALPTGFEIDINGNVLRIRRNDANPFQVDVSDGVGGTHMKGIKGTAQSFSDLPAKGFEGFITKVNGEARNEEDTWYAVFRKEVETEGFWEETVAPGTELSFDSTTMPVQLVNTGLDAFELDVAPWGERVVGDSTSSPDPSFVGKRIEDIFHDRNRLAILTEGTSVWSKTRNPFVFFRDTVQTVLATDPIDIQLSGGERIALARRAVQHGGATFLWAQKAQFFVGKEFEPFEARTAEAPKVSAYEFTEQFAPLPVASSLYFSTDVGGFSTIRDLSIRESRVQGDVNVTAHVSQYITAGVRHGTASDAVFLMALMSDNDATSLYIYNWFFGGGEGERLQSAWNKWRLPQGTEILWIGAEGRTLSLVGQRSDGVVFLEFDLSRNATDPEGSYLTRLDFRITNAGADSITYDPTADETTVTMPYSVGTWSDEDGTPSPVFVVVRADNPDFPASGFTRGRAFTVKSVAGSDIVVQGDATTEDLYVGFRISAERQESEFWLRSERGPVPVDSLSIQRFRVIHSKSGPYRIKVSYNTGQENIYPWDRSFGDPANELNKVVLGNGQLDAEVDADNTDVTITLINDSYFPSHWQAAEYLYVATDRASRRRAGVS